MTLSDARVILAEMTKSASLLRHMRSIELVMAAYAVKYGENEEEWAIAGLLHDADYEVYPDRHPHVIVDKLRFLGQPRIAHAISAHYTKVECSLYQPAG
jgi:predicted hydrolase (HD superfamily)